MFVRSTNKSQAPLSTPPLRFPQKLWKIANECQSGALTWSPHGKSILLRYSLFKGEFMSTKSDFFKTDNISSFVRQLNLYGFRKVYDHAHKQVYKANPDLHEFSNLYFQRDRQDLLEKVTRKSGILKDRNDILLENQCSPDFENNACLESKYDKENVFCEIKSENKSPQLSEEPETKPDISTSSVNKKSQIKEPISKKQVKKKRSYKRSSKPQLFPLSRFPLKPRKLSLPSLKRPDLYRNLVFFHDDEDHPYLRNTSRDVMLSSTLPFQESPEYQELKETYIRIHEPRVRSQHGLLPLNLLYGKVPVNNKTLPRL